jgi:hypothetical protein
MPSEQHDNLVKAIRAMPGFGRGGKVDIAAGRTQMEAMTGVVA